MKSMAAATSFYCAFKTAKKNPYTSLRTKTIQYNEYRHFKVKEAMDLITSPSISVSNPKGMSN